MKPNKEQLIEVIRNGNDKLSHRLILRLDGEFELVAYTTADDWECFKSLNYVTRWSTFEAGEGFVGQAAAKDMRLISEIFGQAKDAWIENQVTGREKILIPSI